MRSASTASACSSSFGSSETASDAIARASSSCMVRMPFVGRVLRALCAAGSSDVSRAGADTALRPPACVGWRRPSGRGCRPGGRRARRTRSARPLRRSRRRRRGRPSRGQSRVGGRDGGGLGEGSQDPAVVVDGCGSPRQVHGLAAGGADLDGCVAESYPLAGWDVPGARQRRGGQGGWGGGGGRRGGGGGGGGGGWGSWGLRGVWR